jgi:hypothetical protein
MRADPFDMGIPEPRFGPPRPPPQPKLYTKLKNRCNAGTVSKEEGDCLPKSCAGSSTLTRPKKVAGLLPLPMSSTSVTEFYTFTQPSVSFVLLEEVLFDFGRSEVHGKVKKAKPNSYRIHCVKLMGNSSVVVDIEIYKADRQLTALRFSKKSFVDSKLFSKFYESVRGNYLKLEKR